VTLVSGRTEVVHRFLDRDGIFLMRSAFFFTTSFSFVLLALVDFSCPNHATEQSVESLSVVSILAINNGVSFFVFPLPQSEGKTA